MTLYMEITPDEYELPVRVTDNVGELASMCKVDKRYIWRYLNHVKNGKIKKPRFIKVEVE